MFINHSNQYSMHTFSSHRHSMLPIFTIPQLQQNSSTDVGLWTLPAGTFLLFWLYSVVESDALSALKAMAVDQIIGKV
jgi:hypothetical protein